MKSADRRLAMVSGTVHMAGHNTNSVNYYLKHEKCRQVWGYTTTANLFYS